MLTEPRLARHFARIGFDIQPVGGPVEHDGIRIPSLLSSSDVVMGLRPMIRPLYEVIEQAVEARAYGRIRSPRVANLEGIARSKSRRSLPGPELM